MSAAADRASQAQSNLRTFALHLLAFVLPSVTLVFWLTGPHSWWASLLWTLPMLTLYWLDSLAPADRLQPPENAADFPYALQLYGLFALQLSNHIAMWITASRLSLHDAHSIVQTLATVLPAMALGGINAGYSGVTVAHELVHRRSFGEQLMGRILLVFVLYEHFATEHVRGHHPRVATYDDPATARFGETHLHFLRRTIPAQFLSAWALESDRLDLEIYHWYSPRMLRHRVLQGVLAELALLFVIGYGFGPMALLFFAIQTLTTLLMLETVNYIEHWGLLRTTKRVNSVDSWDAENWFTHYTLVGLARHSDHHAQASRPFYKLRHCDETAKMASGYYSTIMRAILQNARFREAATLELKRRGLGPFRCEEHEAPAMHVHPALRITAAKSCARS